MKRGKPREIDYLRTELANLWQAIGDLSSLMERMADQLRDEIHQATRPVTTGGVK